MLKFFRILLNKEIQAPPLTWQTSKIGAFCKSLVNEQKSFWKPNKIGKEFYNTMWSKPNTKAVQEVCDKFEKATGVKMLMTDTTEAYSFCNLANVFMQNMQRGKFPKDIKYVIFGHGSGCSLIHSGPDKWHVGYKPEVGIFDFINQNIPKGEKVLVNSCEVTPKQYKHLLPKDKPAIGYPTNTEATSSYYHPLKIVRSGENRIIGGYANGITTMYK